MDHYETRTWRGRHHHMTQTFLAHHFLVRMRLTKGEGGSNEAARRGASDQVEGLGDRPLQPPFELGQKRCREGPPDVASVQAQDLKAGVIRWGTFHQKLSCSSPRP